MAASLVSVLFFLLSFSAHAIDFDESVDAAVSSLDMKKWYDDTEHLASYNRYYRSRDMVRARDWLLNEFTAIGLVAHTEEITIAGYRGYNVVGEIEGSSKKDEIYLVGAHYDSISENPLVAAPGAEDNASGTSALLTIARAIVAHHPKASVRFIAFSGEEAGLFGSKQYVEKIIARGEQDKVKGVLIMDMIGFTEDADLDALIETDERNQWLVELLSASASKYSQGRIETSFSYWGSDHVPFIEQGFQAALLIENDYDDYRDYHRTTDRVANLNIAMAEVIVKMVTGALGYWVL